MWQIAPPRTGDLLLDVGGFEGNWAAEALTRYACEVVVYEPVAAYSQRLAERFRHNERVRVVHAALGADVGTMTIAVAGSGSSLFGPKTGMQAEPVEVRGVVSEFEQFSERSIGCMKINIEGGEYDVLERMAEADLLARVGTFLIQFHTNVPGHEERRKRIQGRLAETHAQTFDYPFVWECWERLQPTQAPPSE